MSFSSDKLFFRLTFVLVALNITPAPLLSAQALSLQALVTPSTVIQKDGRASTFAIHGFIEFKALADLFPYVEAQAQR